MRLNEPSGPRLAQTEVYATFSADSHPAQTEVRASLVAQALACVRPQAHGRIHGSKKSQKGLTLVELIVAFTIMLILSSMAVPLARAKVRAERERALRADLREMHNAIDKYKDYCDAGYLGPPKIGTNCWPETLDILVEGIKLPGSADGKKIRFLRRIPIDPFTGEREWGMRSDQDDPKSTSWGGQDVFDVYSKTDEKAPDGSSYAEW